MAIEPVTREERFLAAAGGQSVTPPTPITRKEQLLQGIIDAVKSGGATPDVIENAVNNYLDANPVKPGATTEQAAQIEQNKTDIADLQTEVDELKESGGNGSGENVNNPWRGKRWLCIGDSITTEGGVYADTGYGKLISSDLGMELTNIAVSGKNAAWGYEVLDECDGQFDLITVMLGTNDHGYACPIGSLNDEHYAAGDYASSGSFYARMQMLVEKLQAKYPKSLVLMLTPIKRTAVNPAHSNITNNEDGYQINTTLNLTTKAYRDVVIDVCNYYSIPCVDLYNTIDPRTEAGRELYFMSAADGTHPNDLGHALKLAPVIKDAVLRHTPYVFPEWDDPGEDTATYTITNALTNVTNSNSAASVAAGASYAATLTAAEGYALGAVSVTMGGEDITGTAYTGGSITIGAVTGNVVITATATADDSGGGDTAEAVLIHAYGLGVKGQSIEDSVGDCDMTASGELHGVHSNEGTWNLDRGESFSLRSKATRNTRFYRVSHRIHTGGRGGMHVAAGNSPYDMTGRFWFGLGAPAGVTATNGDAVVSFWYYTAHDSTAKSAPIYGTKTVAPGDTVELALTFDADTSTVRIYQDGELIGEEVTSVPLAVDGLVVYGNWASELPTDSSLGASPCEYIEMYRGVITV